VMNRGMIEQVGSPLEIYREPASPFVADFVGKVNALPGQVSAGQLRMGALTVPSLLPDGEVKAYLRPEDILARPIAADDPCQFDARIEKIDFLGSFCHVHVSSADLPRALTVYFSLNFLSEQALQVGSVVRLKLMPERLRVF
jgi:iron(III) transport system ATP-binding protein